MTITSPGAKFRQALKDESPLQIIGAINANHAHLAKRAGYRAIYLSGGGVAAGSLGLPDLGINTLDDVLKILDKADVPSGRIYSIADIVADMQYQARGMIEKHKLGDNKEVWLPGIVPKLSGTPGATKWIGPKLGEHTAEVLRGIGYDLAAQDDLRNRGII